MKNSRIHSNNFSSERSANFTLILSEYFARETLKFHEYQKWAEGWWAAKIIIKKIEQNEPDFFINFHVAGVSPPIFVQLSLAVTIIQSLLQNRRRSDDRIKIHLFNN